MRTPIQMLIAQQYVSRQMANSVAFLLEEEGPGIMSMSGRELLSAIDNNLDYTVDAYQQRWGKFQLVKLIAFDDIRIGTENFDDEISDECINAFIERWEKMDSDERMALIMEIVEIVSLQWRQQERNHQASYRRKNWWDD